MITVYRKFQNGKEFMKIMDGVHALSVSTGGNGRLQHSRIQYTNNTLMIQSYKDDHVSMLSSVIEFNAAYRNAIKVVESFFDVE